MSLIVDLTQLNHTGQAAELVAALKNELDEDKLIQLVPELESAKGFQQNHPSHYVDVYQHTLEVIKGLPNHSLLRLTALFHDLGKMDSKVVDDEGIDHFWGHEAKSVEIAKQVLSRLGFDYRIIVLIAMLIQDHDTPVANDDKLVDKAIGYGQIYLEKLQEYQLQEYQPRVKDLDDEKYGQLSQAEVKALGVEILKLLLQHQIRDLKAHSKEYCQRELPGLEELLSRLETI